MFAEAFEEVQSSLPNTIPQRKRLLRAVEEADHYLYEDCSELYEQPAVRVTTCSGSAYLCFPDQCTCPDWTERGPVVGTGEIDSCKHQIACFVKAQFVFPAENAGEAIHFDAPFAHEDPASFPAAPELPDFLAQWQPVEEWTQEEGEEWADRQDADRPGRLSLAC